MTAFAIYFAYGSNLDPEQMRTRCPGHRALGPAWLPDYRLCLPRRSPRRRCGTAGIEPQAGQGVWGALYELTTDDMARLDGSEGYWPRRPPEESRHRPGLLQVRRGAIDGMVITAYTYFAVAVGTNALPSPDYMGHIIRGAEHHCLPPGYIAALRAIATEPAA